MNAVIGHLDADCFYVSCERVRFPCLRKQPVGVLGNQGVFVIAKSYELKQQGVPTGMAIKEAAHLCPEAIFVKRDFRWYEEVSRRMLGCVTAVSPRVEFYSIDECFFDAGLLPRITLKKGTGSAGACPLFQDFQQAALLLQRHIFDRVGVPVSVGISRSRTLAKLVSKTVKPFGCETVLEPAEIAALLENMPVKQITGVGRRSEAKLAAHNIRTCAQFVQADRRLIRKLLTKSGEDLWWELRGEAVVPIVTTRPRHHCVSRGGWLGVPVTTEKRLVAWLVRHIERLVEALNFHEYVCSRMGLQLEVKNMGYVGDSATLLEATSSSELLIPAGKELLDRLWAPGMTVTRMHVMADRLAVRGEQQMSLFRPPDRQIDRIKAMVNERCGRFVLRSAETLPLEDIYRDTANEYDICDIYGKSCF
jgi:nucleotidyltransferase/DNA polymerase involved in DNA repair